MSQNRIFRILGLFVGSITLALPCSSAAANIYEWEYINPSDPSQGRQESSVLLTTKDASPGAILRNTYLRKAYLAGTDLSGAAFGEYEIDFGLVIPAANLTEADFTGTDLTDATLYRSTITGAFFTDAVIAGASLSDTSLNYQQLASTASYQNGGLAGVGLSYNNMAGWDLSNLDMSNSFMTSSILTGANLSNSTLTSVWLQYAELTGANLSGADLSNATLQGADAPNADFTGANLTHATLRQMDATNVDFTGADLSSVRFDDSDLTGADLTDATINGVWFYRVAFASPAQLISTASYKNGDLSRVAIRGDVSSREQDLSGINLSGFNLTNVAFRAIFDGADLSGANLTGAQLDGSSFIGSDFTDANITDAYFDTLSLSQLMSTANYKAKDLSGLFVENYDLSDLDLSGFNLSGFGALTSDLSSTNLSGADLTDAGLAGSDLSGTDFTDAIIVEMGLNETTHVGFTYQQLTSTASFKAGDLSGLSLAHNDLSGWDLSDLQLTGATLGSSVGPHFGGETTTNLTDVDLSRSNLTGANFIGSNLTNTDFTDAIITGARFKDAINLTEAQVQSTASYKTSDLSGILWWNLDLSGWDFSNLDLSGGDFKSVAFVGTDLSGSNLTHSIFGGSTFDLFGANLRGTDTRGSTFFYVDEIDEAADSQNLIRPNGTIEDGLILQSGESMLIRDYLDEDGIAGLPITVLDTFDIDANGTLRVIFEDPDWGSTIQFDASVGTANLGGTLELGVDILDGLNMQDLLGSTFQLFDWTGVNIVGGFDAIVVDPAWYAAGLSFDLSQLMTTGEVHIVSVMGDLNGDAFVGIEDLNIVLAHWNQAVTPGSLLEGDLNGDGFVGIEDLNGLLSTWNGAFPEFSSDPQTAIPEPTAGLLISAGGVSLLRRKHRRLS